ncbi:folate transporter 1-like isoform X2 [Hermetia illucens]|uniref:folate transporter 1-like isoform X2 n=1 Tax=Hermetia illucens TaxID=343691 RepID=UPI0018CC1C61|nr:folate transporter 1-like isoform X2 [Hermetia illucens]
MKEWLSTTIILCTFGFFREFRPSDRSGFSWIASAEKNVTEAEADDLEKWGQNSYLSHSAFMFLITDYLLYQPILVFSAVVGIILWTMVISATTSEAIGAIQVLHGTYKSAELAYFTYIYAKVEKKYFFTVSVLTRSTGLFSSAISSALGELLVNSGSCTEANLNYISLAAQFASLLVAITLPRVYHAWTYEQAVADAATSATEDTAEAVADATVQATEAATQSAVDAAIQATAEAIGNSSSETVKGIPSQEHQGSTTDETDYTDVNIEGSEQLSSETESYSETKANRRKPPKVRTVGAQARKLNPHLTINQVEYIRRRIAEALDVDEIAVDICRRALHKLNEERGSEIVGSRKEDITELQLARGWKQKFQEIAGSGEKGINKITDGIKNKVIPKGFEDAAKKATEGIKEKTEKITDDLKEKIAGKIQARVGKATDKIQNIPLIGSLKGIKQMLLFVVRTYSNLFILKWSLWWIVANSVFLLVSSSSQVLWRGIDPDYHDSSKVIFTVHRQFTRSFEVWLLAAASAVQSVLILIMSLTSRLWFSYSAYVLFSIVYNFLITYASGLISKELEDQTYGMIFGINTFVSLSINSAIRSVWISKDGFKLGRRTRFYLFSGFFLIVAGVYGIIGFVNQPYLLGKVKVLKLKFMKLISKLLAWLRNRILTIKQKS